MFRHATHQQPLPNPFQPLSALPPYPCADKGLWHHSGESNRPRKDWTWQYSPLPQLMSAVTAQVMQRAILGPPSRRIEVALLLESGIAAAFATYSALIERLCAADLDPSRSAALQSPAPTSATSSVPPDRPPTAPWVSPRLATMLNNLRAVELRQFEAGEVVRAFALKGRVAGWGSDVPDEEGKEQGVENGGGDREGGSTGQDVSDDVSEMSEDMTTEELLLEVPESLREGVSAVGRASAAAGERLREAMRGVMREVGGRMSGMLGFYTRKALRASMQPGSALGKEEGELFK